ncbi:MAG: CRISPR-associated protein Cas4 [Bacteroidetes bacterium]|nr:CRISPR-associated protein Cas4 [Bacteroidota bacterium]
MQITGTHINYYCVCKRELWLFAHNIQMEHTSDLVYTGKVIDETSYSREDKGIDIDGVINIDWIDTNTGVIHEVKKSDSVEKAHEMQVLYYLWYLKHKGVEGVTAEIDYPLLKQRTKVELTQEKKEELEEAMQSIKAIAEQAHPPDRINKKFCKTCSYYELCWAGV